MVPGCANGSRKTKGIPVSYHRLPKDEKMRKIWLNRIRRDNPPQAKSCYVCSMHFTREWRERGKAKTSLKIGSVPSIFPFQEPKNERVSSQSRIQKQNNLLKKVETEQV